MNETAWRFRVERRYASGRAERYPELLRDLADQKAQLVFVLNQKVAHVLGVVLPQALLLRADEVIR